MSRTDLTGRNLIAILDIAALGYATYPFYDFFHAANQLGRDAEKLGNALENCAKNPAKCDAEKLNRCQRDMYGQAGAAGNVGVHAASEANANR